MAAAPDTVHTGPLTVLGIGGIIFTYFCVLLLQALYFREVKIQWHEKVIGVPTVEADAVLVEQMNALRTYGVVDAEAGLYRVPVSEAMKNVAEQIGR